MKIWTMRPGIFDYLFVSEYRISILVTEEVEDDDDLDQRKAVMMIYLVTGFKYKGHAWILQRFTS